jgi:hypothetical protein
MAGRDSRTPSPYSSSDELAGIFGGMQIGASPRASPRPSVVPIMRTPSPRASPSTFTSRRIAVPKTKAPKKPKAQKGGKYQAKPKAQPVKRQSGKKSPPQKRKK